MKTSAGLWIDHREAVVVSVFDTGEVTEVVRSNIERQPRRQGGKCSTLPCKARQVPADDSRERKFMGRLNEYYDRVIASLGGVATVVIFGPGEAKRELKKRIERERSGLWVAGLITADKMTADQIAAKVRGFFRHPGSVVLSG